MSDHMCPVCQQQVGCRVAPSGTVRLRRHPHEGKSCLGTGWEGTPP